MSEMHEEAYRIENEKSANEYRRRVSGGRMIGYYAFLAVSLSVITFSLLSNTLAKYIAISGGQDIARVAQFSFEVSDQGGNLLDSLGTQRLQIFDTVDSGVSAGTGDEKLIAPGTAGSFSINVANNSEVNIAATISLSETNSASIPIVYGFGDKYYTSVSPVNNKVGGRTVEGGLDTLVAAIAASQSPIAMGGSEHLYFTWEWAFDAGVAAENMNDTALGLQGTDTVSLVIECIVAQLDT